MRVFHLIAASLAYFVVTGPAAGSPEIVVAFERGQYDRAAELGEARGTADALALAAQSLLARYVIDHDTAPESVLDDAERLARSALEAEPGHGSASLQLAAALSFKVRHMDARQAYRSGYGELARDLAEHVLVQDPENAWAEGFLAVWHIEVRRRGGRIGAMMLGASLDVAEDHYRRAVALNPNSPSLHWQYARALTALDVTRFEDRIRDALDLALSCDAETDLERTMQQRAQALRVGLTDEAPNYGALASKAADQL